MKMKIFGIPLKINPLFFVIIAFLGAGRLDTPVLLGVWVVVVTISIIIHELGHAFAAKAFGLTPSIMLYGMGGLTFYQAEERGNVSHLKSIAISLAGPAAGFVVGGVVFALALALPGVEEGSWGDVAIADALWVNIGWGLLNLLPMLPLDGGNVAASLFSMASPKHGKRAAMILSAALATITAVVAAVMGYWWGAMLAGYFAWMNGKALFAKETPESAAPKGFNPESPGGKIIVEAIERYKGGRRQEGKSALYRAIEGDLEAPERLVALDVLARICVTEGEYDEAASVLARFPRDNRPDPHLVGKIAFGRERFGEAVAPLAQALSNEPDADIAVMLAKAHIKNGDKDKALRLIDALGRTLPEEELDHVEQSIAYYAGDLERSLEAGARVFGREPSVVIAHNMGCTLLDLGRVGESYAWFDRGFDIDPVEAASLLVADAGCAPLRADAGFEAWAADKPELARMLEDDR